MEVIRFPGAAKLNKKAKKGYNLKVQKVADSPKNKVILGPVEYTCPHCHNKIKFHSEGIIFKSLDFYCGSCGNRSKIANPAFSDTNISHAVKKKIEEL